MASGALDVENARYLRQAIDDAFAAAPPPRELVLDVSALDFIDSSGLATLVDASREAQKHGIDFGVLRGDGKVRQVLHSTQLDRRLRILD